MKNVEYTQTIAHTTQHLSGSGVFLTVGGATPNTMTIGWGSVGYYWGKPVFTVVVRPTRHTHGILLAEKEFTVSVPKGRELDKALAFCGSTSGRNTNKFEGHGISTLAGQQVNAPVIAEAFLHYECRVLLMQDMTEDRFDPSTLNRWYPARDLHTVFFGEILACYER